MNEPTTTITKAQPPADNHKQVRPEQVFLDAYNELCNKHGFELRAVPALMARDDNTFSIIVNLTVVPK